MFLTHGQYIPGDMAIQQKIDIVDQSNSSIPRLVKESNGSIILHLQGQGHQRKTFLLLIRMCSMSERS